LCKTFLELVERFRYGAFGEMMFGMKQWNAGEEKRGVLNYESVTNGGAVAQLGARLDGIEEVVGSNPIGSTNSRKIQPRKPLVVVLLVVVLPCCCAG
jgi:hypothetical protein